MAPVKLTRILLKSLVANLLPPALFDPGADRATVRRLFSSFVRVVEIEAHSYCNRVCWFCPNKTIDRRGSPLVMQDAVYHKILADLASIAYRGTLIWSRYHEPLAHEAVFSQLAKARGALPRAYLAIVSNGDYLDRTSLSRLVEAGLDRLMVDLYLPDGTSRTPAIAREAIGRLSRRTSLDLVERGPFEYECQAGSIFVNVGVPEYTVQNISTRGGLVDVPGLSSYQRRAVCFSPVHSVVVDYDGSGMLCCQTRADAPQHASAIIGSLAAPDYGIFDLYRDLAPARRALLAPGAKTGVCTTCSVSAIGPDRLARRVPLAGLSAVPGVAAMTMALARFAARRRQYER